MGHYILCDKNFFIGPFVQYQIYQVIMQVIKMSLKRKKNIYILRNLSQVPTHQPKGMRICYCIYSFPSFFSFFLFFFFYFCNFKGEMSFDEIGQILGEESIIMGKEQVLKRKTKTKLSINGMEGNRRQRKSQI